MPSYEVAIFPILRGEQDEYGVEMSRKVYPVGAVIEMTEEDARQHVATGTLIPVTQPAPAPEVMPNLPTPADLTQSIHMGRRGPRPRVGTRPRAKK